MKSETPGEKKGGRLGRPVYRLAPYFGCADCSGVGGVWLVGGVPLGVLGLALVGTDPLGCTGAASPVGDALPFPVTVMRSITLRFPAYDCAMRSAVCFSFPVETVPESWMVESV